MQTFMLRPLLFLNLFFCFLSLPISLSFICIWLFFQFLFTFLPFSFFLQWFLTKSGTRYLIWKLARRWSYQAYLFWDTADVYENKLVTWEICGVFSKSKQPLNYFRIIKLWIHFQGSRGRDPKLVLNIRPQSTASFETRRGEESHCQGPPSHLRQIRQHRYGLFR